MKLNTFQDLLSTSLTYKETITLGDIVVCLLITFALALFIYWIYKKTYSGVLYSKDFSISLIIVSMIVAIIMMGISRNLALSLGLVGALSIVRFRNAVKSTRDVTFLFWSISVGIINGVQFYKLSIVASIVIGLVLMIMYTQIKPSLPYLLILNYSSLDENKLEQILRKHCKKYLIKNCTLTEDDGNEKVIEVKIKEKSENVLLSDLKTIKGIAKINLFSYNGELRD